LKSESITVDDGDDDQVKLCIFLLIMNIQI